MLLEGKTAVVYGAAGAVGGAVSRAFARDGAHVLLTGRTQSTLDAVADDIRSAGGSAQTAIVDALDRRQVGEHLAGVAAHRNLDISFNAIDGRDVQGMPLVDFETDDFVRTIELRARTNFITATATARQMRTQRSGVILAISARPDLMSVGNTGGFGVSCAALESLFRQLAIELGPEGIRAVCLRSAGSPDAPGVKEIFERIARDAGLTFEEFLTTAESGSPLRHLPSLAEVANVAVLMASDRASAITGAIANITCGGIVD